MFNVTTKFQKINYGTLKVGYWIYNNYPGLNFYINAMNTFVSTATAYPSGRQYQAVVQPSGHHYHAAGWMYPDLVIFEVTEWHSLLNVSIALQSKIFPMGTGFLPPDVSRELIPIEFTVEANYQKTIAADLRKRNIFMHVSDFVLTHRYASDALTLWNKIRSSQGPALSPLFALAGYEVIPADNQGLSSLWTLLTVVTIHETELECDAAIAHCKTFIQNKGDKQKKHSFAGNLILV